MVRITFIADELRACDRRLAAALEHELRAALERADVAEMTCRVLVQLAPDGSIGTIRVQFERPGAVLSVGLAEDAPLATARSRAATILRLAGARLGRVPPPDAPRPIATRR